jgi:putative ABC transport system permease protein
VNDFALAWRLARRELRAGLGGFRVFLACLAIGVAAIAGVGSLSQAVVEGLRADGRVILGGDVDLRLHSQPPTLQQDAFLAETAARVSRTVGLRAMARPAAKPGRLSLVELKAVDAAYPLIGAMELEPPGPLAPALAKIEGTWGAVADGNLLGRLGIGIGGRVKVGEAVFTIRATIHREPDRVAGILSFGPRLMIAADALAATGLLRPGSQVRFHRRVVLAPTVDRDAWTERLKDTFPEAGWRIRGIDDAAPGVRRFIERMTLFLGFAGMTALLVGGIGVSNAVRAYVDGKTATIAVMKSIGAPGGLVFSIYLLQVLALAGVGIGIGLALGAGVPAVAAWGLAGVLPVAPRIDFYAAPLVTAAVFGLLTAVTFAIWPLARARSVPAAGLFRARIAPPTGRPGTAAIVAVAVGALALAALTLATATDRVFAAWFVGGAIATLLALAGGARLLAAVARRFAAVPSPVWRLALANIHRPGSPATSIVLSLGLGISVLVAVAEIEGNLTRQIDERLPETAPAFFFIDIQPDQVDAFDRTVAEIPGSGAVRRVPTLRGRIVRIDGVPVEKAKIAPEIEWAVRGDRVITYAATAADDVRITAGDWWPADYAGPPLISLDAGVARGFGVVPGQTLSVNVLGREIEAVIGSLREIDWRSLRFDFAIIFAPGTLEAAPHTHIAAVNATAAAEDAVERAVADRFANISAIRVREALAAVAGLLAGIGTAVTSTASIAVIAGALVLAGAVAAGQRRRIYDAVVFKVLGATRRAALGAVTAEFAVIGLATGAAASVIGTLTAWAVVVFLMRMEWTFLPGVAAATVTASLIATLILGFAGTWRALGGKAAPYLRNE